MPPAAEVSPFWGKGSVGLIFPPPRGSLPGATEGGLVPLLRCRHGVGCGSGCHPALLVPARWESDQRLMTGLTDTPSANCSADVFPARPTPYFFLCAPFIVTNLRPLAGNPC